MMLHRYDGFQPSPRGEWCLIKNQWRVTKYDPKNRDDTGVYRWSDWTDVSDIGRLFNGTRLTGESYLDTESRYVCACLHFLAESSLAEVTIKHASPPQAGLALDKYGLNDILAEGRLLQAGDRISGDELDRALRLTLRSLQGFQFEDPDRFFIHIGYDYYMYIGSFHPCPRSIEFTRNLGLFVEVFNSPYSSDGM
jgi:hypothetical protein